MIRPLISRAPGVSKQLLAVGSLALLAGLASADAHASPPVNTTRWLSTQPVTQQKLAGGLPLVFSRRPSLDPSQRSFPALSSAPVAVTLAAPLDYASLASLERGGLRVSRRADGSPRHIGQTVLGQIRAEQLPALAALPNVVRIRLDGSPLGMLAPIEVTAAEIGAPDVWRSKDQNGLPVTGRGVRVCDSDTGLDIFHPSFFFADGGYFAWIDTNANGVFDVGVDGIDTNGDGVVEPLSVLNSLVSSYYDPEPLFGSGDPSYQVGLDWLYIDQNGNGTRDHGRDAGFDDSTPGFGELIVVLDDVNGNGHIDIGEKFVALGRSKVIAARYEAQTFLRGDNLIDLPRTEEMAHGTSSAAVIAGGHFGLTKKLGIAPDAELIIAARTAENGDLLEMADFCLEHGARVMLHEYAPWAGYHVDGSSEMEKLIDQSSADGVAHINPAGNLSTSQKLYKHLHPAGQTTSIAVLVDDAPQPYRVLVASVLWREPDRPVSVTVEDPNGNLMQMPESGILYEPFGGPLYIYGERETSDRGTVLLNLYVFDPDDNPAPLPTGSWHFHVADGDAGAAPLEVISYVQDEISGWGEGIRFEDHVSEDHLIGWPGTADQGIAVAAYTGNGYRIGTPGERAFYSGRGYRIDGTEILSLSAPADPVVAGYFPEGEARYSIFGGTSGASPHVAGAAALLIQDNPGLNGDQVRQALRGGALADSAVGAIPNHDWGYGKLRVFNSLYGASPAPNSAPLIKGFEADVPTGQSSGFVVSASDAEDGADSLRIEIDQDYDGNYEQLADQGVVAVRFDEPGLYYSKLRVTDSGGLTDETLAIFTVSGEGGKPLAAGGPDLTGRGCGCNLPGDQAPSGRWPWLALGLPLLVALRRRRSIRGRHDR